jgi:hypothetical protein
MKSVPNLISYLHKFSWNFSQFLAICFELLSFGSVFILEIADAWDPPVSLPLSALGPPVSAPTPRGCHAHAPRCALKALSGPRVSVPTAICVPTALPMPPRLTRHRPDRACPPRQPGRSPRLTRHRPRVRACHAAVADAAIYPSDAPVSAPLVNAITSWILEVISPPPSPSCLSSPPSSRVGSR